MISLLKTYIRKISDISFLFNEIAHESALKEIIIIGGYYGHIT